MNITVVTGHLSRPPERRTLPSGDELVSYDVTVPRADERAESVPVVWPGAPASATDLQPGDLVVVLGRVRRRFFRAGGATQSRTEVLAERVVPARRATAARRLLSEASAGLSEGGEALRAAKPVRARG